VDQYATWYVDRPRPKPHCVRCGSSFPKRGTAPIFSPCLLWPNGWMDQDATWYGSRLWPRPHCVRWDPAPPKRGTAPTFRLMFSCGQTAGWIKMPLGTKVGLGPATSCFVWTQLHPLEEQSTSIFGPCLLWPNGWMDQDAT